MAAIDFPNSPSTGQIFEDPNGATWQFNGTAWLLLSISPDIWLSANSGQIGTLAGGTGERMLCFAGVGGSLTLFGGSHGSFPGEWELIVAAPGHGTVSVLRGTLAGGLLFNGDTVWTGGNDGAGSGLDADLLDGKNSSTTATANTIGARDASGDYFARYFNQSSSAENPTIGTVFVENSGADGYHRKISLANFMAQLVTTTTTAPTPTAGSGAFTTVSASVTTQRLLGENFYRVTVTVTITANGTAASFINVPLGITASKESVLAGRCAAISGNMVQGLVAADTSTLTILAYNNAYPGASGERITLSGVVYV